MIELAALRRRSVRGLHEPVQGHAHVEDHSGHIYLLGSILHLIRPRVSPLRTRRDGGDDPLERLPGAAPGEEGATSSGVEDEQLHSRAILLRRRWRFRVRTTYLCLPPSSAAGEGLMPSTGIRPDAPGFQTSLAETHRGPRLAG